MRCARGQATSDLFLFRTQPHRICVAHAPVYLEILVALSFAKDIRPPFCDSAGQECCLISTGAQE